MTYKEFLANHSDHISLINAVRNQLDVDSDEEFFEQLENVSSCSCGANGGFHGFIYYDETNKFWVKNKPLIKSLMKEETLEFGYGSRVELVLSFNSIGDYTEEEVGEAIYGKYNDELFHLYDLFAKYALEEVANWYDNDKNN